MQLEAQARGIIGGKGKNGRIRRSTEPRRSTSANRFDVLLQEVCWTNSASASSFTSCNRSSNCLFWRFCISWVEIAWSHKVFVFVWESYSLSFGVCLKNAYITELWKIAYCCRTCAWFQKSASIQSKTSPTKFGRIFAPKLICQIAKNPRRSSSLAGSQWTIRRTSRTTSTPPRVRFLFR